MFVHTAGSCRGINMIKIITPAAGGDTGEQRIAACASGKRQIPKAVRCSMVDSGIGFRQRQ